jgi:predicted PurR-regulated permease PerM
VIALYFMLKDGGRFKKRVVEISPLPDSQDEEIIGKTKAAINSVIRGAVILAIIQGVTACIGYFIFGVPNAVLWGGVTAFAAMIPGIGTALVLTPMIIYMIITGSTGSAIGLILWGFFAVGLIDNFFGPKLWGMGMRVHTFFILISVLGGIQLFGLVGFVLGPVIISFFFALLDLYSTVFKPIKPQKL